MSTTIFKQTLIVAGLSVNVFSYSPLFERGRPLALLFLLHGRQGSANMLESITEQVLTYAASQGPTNRELVVVTFADPHANNDWTTNNQQHAIDMYAIQTGTASDVSFLIDFLPAYLFPSGERDIQEWMLSGISLGGHSTWIALRDEPRIKIGIPIIGCPDYLALMTPRAQASGLSVTSPYFPSSLLDYIRRHDPSSAGAVSHDTSQNPFLGKHVLVLSGANDQLVPWSASKGFVETLHVGNGTKKVVVEEGVGHECTPCMVSELARFVWEHGVKTPFKSSH